MSIIGKSCAKLIRFYQLTVSSILPPACRFYPSCSEYALIALKTHSFPSAIWLISKRLLKCQPFCRGGIDPVPAKHNRKN